MSSSDTDDEFNFFSREQIKKRKEEARLRDSLLTPEQKEKKRQEQEVLLKTQRLLEQQRERELENLRLEKIRKFDELERKFINKLLTIKKLINSFENKDDFKDFIKHLLNKKNSKMLFSLYNNDVDINIVSLEEPEIKLYNELIVFEEIKSYINKNNLDSIENLFNFLIEYNYFTRAKIYQFVREYNELSQFAREKQRFEIYNYLQGFHQYPGPLLPQQKTDVPQVAGNIVQYYNKYYKLRCN